MMKQGPPFFLNYIFTSLLIAHFPGTDFLILPPLQCPPHPPPPPLLHHQTPQVLRKNPIKSMETTNLPHQIYQFSLLLAPLGSSSLHTHAQVLVLRKPLFEIAFDASENTLKPFLSSAHRALPPISSMSQLA